MVLLAFLPIVILFAIACAGWDNEEIIYRIRTGGESLDHAPMWQFRALCVVILSIPAAHLLGNWWTLVPLWVMGAFGFSAAFRYRLNRLRGLDWRYCSPSSWYDYGFLVLSGAWQWKPHSRWTWSNWRGFMRHSHWNNYELNPPYVKQVHRAGTIAYITEITITAACIVWALYIQA